MVDNEVTDSFLVSGETQSMSVGFCFDTDPHHIVTPNTAPEMLWSGLFAEQSSFAPEFVFLGVVTLS